MLVLKPALAILDEPAEGIQELKCRGGAVLLITHTEAIARIADRASYLCGSRIVLSGDPQTVAERDNSRRCLVCTGEARG